MSEQYFKAVPTSYQHEREISEQVAETALRLLTDNGVFSKNRMDFGSKVLVETFLAYERDKVGQRILELGSGYGPVSLAIAKCMATSQVIGVEVNRRAFELAQENAQLNQVENAQFELADICSWQVSPKYDAVLTNPPIRAGKAVIQTFVKQAKLALKPGGSVWIVIQKKQGAPSMERFMAAEFGNVSLITREKGYWILKSVK